MDKETYHIRIEVMDANGRSIKDKNGLVRSAIQAEVTIDPKINYANALRTYMTNVGKTVSAWVPEDNIISVEASVKNGFTNTYMVMCSYYANEDRFVKH